MLDEKDVVGGSIPLPLVQTAQAAGGPSFRSPRSSYKVELSTHAWGELTIVFRGGETSSYSQSAKHRDDALSAILRALKRKAWNEREREAMKEALRPSRAIASRKVGVDAIMTQNALRREYTIHMISSIATYESLNIFLLQIGRMQIWPMQLLGERVMGVVPNLLPSVLPV